jgi:hypothetical protein
MPQRTCTGARVVTWAHEREFFRLNCHFVNEHAARARCPEQFASRSAIRGLMVRGDAGGNTMFLVTLRFSDSIQLSRPIRRLLMVLIAAVSLAALAATSSQSGHVAALAATSSQSGHVALGGTPQPEDCEDYGCFIWGLAAGNVLLKINVCTQTVVGTAVLNGPAVQTIAAGPRSLLTWPNLQYGDVFGGLWCTSGFPPSPLTPCGPVATGANGLARAGNELYAIGDIPPVPGCFFDPLMTVGCGGFDYFTPLGGADIVCRPLTGRLLADAAFPPGGANGALFDISRANGFQSNPRPLGGRTTFSGYAYDGADRLWGSLFAVAGALQIVDRLSGVGVPVPMPGIPGGMLDMASDECFSCVESGHDVGDAPDSTNHFSLPMTAYLAIGAQFPSVIDVGTGAPPGPFHRINSQDSWLGYNVNAEQDGDQLPDDDLVTNIYPPTNVADRDGADDGVLLPLYLPACRMAQINYRMTVRDGTHDRYTNVWFDFNRNGQWGDQIQCVDPDTQQLVTVNEWAVQDQLTTLGVGVHVIATPLFRSLDPDERLWMRITLSETTAPPAASDGRGYDDGYEIGETEDYTLAPIGGGNYQ